MIIQKNYFYKENIAKKDYKMEINTIIAIRKAEQNLQRYQKKFTAKKTKKNLEVGMINLLNGTKEEMIKNLVNLCSNKQN